MAAKTGATLTDDERSRLVADLLVFLGGHLEELERLLGTTGLSPSELREGLGDPSFEDGLLGYLSQSEPLLLALCAETGRDPALVSAQLARRLEMG